MPGPPELLLILAIVLIVFGASRLPQIGDALGKGISNFKKSISGKDEIEINPPPGEIEDASEPIAAVTEVEVTVAPGAEEVAEVSAETTDKEAGEA